MSKDRSDKWDMFKQFLHNELEISKEDIREWITEAVKDEAKKMINNSFCDFEPKDVIKQIIFSNDFYGNEELQADVKNLFIQEISQNYALMKIK